MVVRKKYQEMRFFRQFSILNIFYIKYIMAKSMKTMKSMKSMKTMKTMKSMKTKKTRKTRKTKKSMKTKKRKTKKIMKKKTQMGGNEARYAKFYDIADVVELSNDDEDLSRIERRDKFNNNIIGELRTNPKYKVGDILYTGNDDYPFAIVDEQNGDKIFTVNDNPAYLPLFRMLPKVKEHNVKYQRIFENVNELREYRELFFRNEGEVPGIVADYIHAGIYSIQGQD